jgi:BirA family biotin operon repressor/biotin-[acetyl-CoA-carboxylase] ligase
MCTKRSKNILNIDKLHATESTNDYLKLRFRESKLTQFHTVITENQTAGKGQMGAGWISEAGKNLTFSMLLFNELELTPFEVSKWVAVTLVEFIEQELNIPAKIKWPNDILSVDKKIAGILIENFFKAGRLSHSIIGIGLNVNQMEFIDLPKANSLGQITGKTYNLDQLLIQFLSYCEKKWPAATNNLVRYESHLYGYLQTKPFLIQGKLQDAIIKGTDVQGRLLLEINGQDKVFDLKEVTWVY